MHTSIKINGLMFGIDGDGFSHAEDDFARIVELIDISLSELDSATVARLHDAAIFTDDCEPTDPAAFDELNAIATAATSKALVEWSDTSDAFVTITAIAPA